MSDIFDEYCRIMEEKGHIRKDAQKSKSPTRVEKETSEDYREKIKALYGIDIKLNDSDKSIIEQAHPETVVVAPAYDRMNGVVENIQERHNVMTGIALKRNNGNLTQHRYAKKELLDELVRLGFSLDNEGEEEFATEITSIAAEFANEKPIKKEAIVPALVAGALASPWFWGAVAGVGTWGYVKSNFLGYIDQGVKNDTERAIEALKGLKEHVDGPDKSSVNTYIAAFSRFKEETDKALSILSRSRVEDVSVKSSEDILKAKRKIVGTKKEIDFAKKYLKMAAYVADAIGSTSATAGILSNTSEKDILPTLSRMTVVAKDVESEWWQITKSLWSNSFGGVTGGGDVKTHAINSVSSVRDSILALIHNYQVDSSEAAVEAKDKAVSVRDAFAKAVGADTGSETAPSAKPSAKPTS